MGTSLVIFFSCGVFIKKLFEAMSDNNVTPEAALFGVCSISIEQCLEDASAARLWRESASTAIAKLGTVDTAKFTGMFGELLRK